MTQLWGSEHVENPGRADFGLGGCRALVSHRGLDGSRTEMPSVGVTTEQDPESVCPQAAEPAEIALGRTRGRRSGPQFSFSSTTSSSTGRPSRRHRSFTSN